MTEDPIQRARADGRTALTEAEGKALLAEYGVPVPESVLAATPDEAAAAAEEIGFPVVVKVSSPQVTHKSDWADGAGVALGLTDAAAVREASEAILAAADAQGIDAEVFVEAGVDTESGTELIVGGVRDPSFGPTVLVGLGGVFTEVFEDVSHRLAPVSEGEADAMLDDLDAADLLAGYRDAPAVDRAAVARVVRAVGDLLAERDEVAEVDLNPVLATDAGATALDALVVLTDE